MTTKKEGEEAWRGIVSLCKIHSIVCLFVFPLRHTHTHIHQVDHLSLSLFPPDTYILLCLLLSLIAPAFPDSPPFS